MSYELKCCVIYSTSIWQEGRVKVQVGSLQPLIAQERIQPQASPYTVYSGPSFTETDFCLNTSICPYHYHSTNSR